MLKDLKINLIYFLKLFYSKIFYLFIFRPTVGSSNWFIKKEIYFGGYKKNIKRKIVSNLDHRSSSEITQGGMTGGDRMLIHGYASSYSKHLSNYTKDYLNKFNILEIGILEGTGLAVWAETFPNSNIYGADIDLSNFESNKINLISKSNNILENIEVFKFDQLEPYKYEINQIKKNSLDIVIDDGLHSKDSIIKTAKFLKPYLSDEFVYFIEDVNFDLLDSVKLIFPNSKLYESGKLIVVSNILKK